MKKPDQKRILSVGNTVLIRTVTHYYTGRIIYIDQTVIELEQAAWIADTGRFSECLKTGVLSEVEPYPDQVAVFIGAVVDVSKWEHDLPTTVK